ncbi:fimbrial protein, partial [Serratia marcescens]|uniref:fimbrial protein n=1 Tax=Serratia marcescens TaxID=615 RepID=UPI003C70526C
SRPNRVRDIPQPQRISILCIFAILDPFRRQDSEQPGFLALDAASTAQGVGIGMEKTDGTAVLINNTSGATFVLSSGNND